VKICVDGVLGINGDTEWSSAFAAVRPPGHHAGTSNRISGFCFFNNIAVGAVYARYLLKNNPKFKIQEPRIVVFDWDVHHGDSTQRLFNKSKDILFISMHRKDYGKFFPPGTGAITDFGEEEGEGYCLNMCWNTKPGNDYRVRKILQFQNFNQILESWR
jgi:histone deacetylase 6